MAKRVLVDVAAIGSKGGKARAAGLSKEERSAASADAVNARWAEYYRLHPEKLEERKRRDAARKAAQKRKAKKAGK